MSPNPLRNTSSDRVAFLGLREVPGWAKNSKASSFISPMTPKQRVTISPAPHSSAAANTRSARTVHLPRILRSSRPQCNPRQLQRALSHCRPPWVSSGHPLHSEALPLTHAAGNQQCPLRDVGLPASQLPLPPPHPLSSADANSKAGAIGCRRPLLGVPRTGGGPAPPTR